MNFMEIVRREKGCHMFGLQKLKAYLSFKNILFVDAEYQRTDGDLFFTEKECPRWVGVLPKPCTRPHPPPGDHQPALNSHNKSQFLFPNKAHYLCNSHPTIPSSVNFPLKKVKY